MMDQTELRRLIQATLDPMLLYSPAAEELLIATCAQESAMGKYRQQIGGPALGIFQMEPNTYVDIWTNYLAYHPILYSKIFALAPGQNDGKQQRPLTLTLVDNDALAIAMARVQYLRAPGVLPAADDLKGLWLYYKAHYNTLKGAATIEQFYRNYKTLVHGVAA